jgi:hypothetical protein
MVGECKQRCRPPAPGAADRYISISRSRPRVSAASWETPSSLADGERFPKKAHTAGGYSRIRGQKRMTRPPPPRRMGASVAGGPRVHTYPHRHTLASRCNRKMLALPLSVPPLLPTPSHGACCRFRRDSACRLSLALHRKRTSEHGSADTWPLSSHPHHQVRSQLLGLPGHSTATTTKIYGGQLGHVKLRRTVRSKANHECP